jgi:L-lactate utilization protein LutB
LVTIGDHANKFLARKARDNGCTVYEAKDAADAGRFVLEKMNRDTIILAKGSQNGVFAEEALKPLLKNKSDLHRGELEIVPWLDFTEEWDDNKLFAKFDVSQELQDYIKDFLPDFHEIRK